MWDSISYKLYGTEAGMNALIEANQERADIVVFPSGVVLDVPDYTPPAAENLPPWRRP
jgi:phage tail protein X